MSDESGANVVFGGDATGAVEAAKKTAEAVKSSVEGMKGSFEALQGHFEYVTKGFAAITTAVAGGKALKEFVSEADSVVKEAGAMGKSLGVSATEASVFGVALEEAGISSDAVSLASKRLTMDLAQGGEKFAALGINTKDTNGQFKNSRDLMLEVNEKLRGFKEGTDRNIEANKIYGRSYQDLSKFINKFTYDQEEAQKLAESLNLVVGQESVDASRKYNEAKRGMQTVMKGIERTIGEALIPRLTQMAEFFRSSGPAAVSAMRGVMSVYLTIQDAVGDSVKALWGVAQVAFKGIGDIIKSVFGSGGSGLTAMQFFSNVLTVIRVAVIGLRVVVEEGFAAIGGAISLTVDWLRTFNEVAGKVLAGDFSGAVDAWKLGIDRRTEIVAAGVQRMRGIATKGAADIMAALDSDPMSAKKLTAAKGASGEGNSASTGKKDEAFKAALAAMQAELAIRKEVAAEALKLLEDQHSKELLSDRDFYAQKVALEQNALDGEASAKRAELANVRVEMTKRENASLAQQNGLKAQAAKIEGELTVIGLKRVEAAVQGERDIENAAAARLTKLETERIAFTKKMADLDVAEKEESLRVAKDFGLITASEELRQQRSLLDEKYRNERKSIEDRLALVKYDAAERTKIADELAALDKKHAVDLKKTVDDGTVESMKPLMNVLASVQSAFGVALNGLLTRTMSFKDGMLNVWQGLTGGIAREIASVLEKKFAAWATEKALALAGITADAAKAGSGAAASQASIPIVGPELAMASMASVMAAVLGLGGSIASARNGFDIPSGVNPITQLHEREMVLPAKDADVIRSMEGVGRARPRAPVELRGVSAGAFFIASRSDLLKVLNGAIQDNAWRPSK